jgi:hypothetical protein
MCCAGCRANLKLSEAQLRCRFHATGFALPGEKMMVPCHTRYHLQCVRAGIPFTSRLQRSEGLFLPAMTEFPNFICEACTVRTALDRELLATPTDVALLMLERMRLIDIVHAWSQGTHKQYQLRLRQLRRFEGTFGVHILCATPLEAPPTSTAITIMWAQQWYAIQPTRRKTDGSPTTNVKYSTVRSLRSAAAQFYRLDLQIAFPQKAFIDSSARAMVSAGCSPTDELSYTLMSAGMSRRLGDESNPSLALSDNHVRYMNDQFERRYHTTQEPRIRTELARAALANLIAWLAWLRAQELFCLCWCDFTITSPIDAATLDLPPGIGAIQLRLLAQTKTDRTRKADVIIAFTTGSGLSPGVWLQRLQSDLGHTLGQSTEGNSSLVFCHQGGQPWSSNFFRTTYLIPSLQEQREMGDPTLRAYDGSTGMTLLEKFWSMHSYRSGARTHVHQHRQFCARKATPSEVSEHARWRMKRSSMDMPTAYLQGPIKDRLALTLLCM